MLQVGFGVKNDQHLSWGVYGVYSSNIKIKALKRYKDILQIQIKYNKMHTVIQHCPHAHLFTIHSFIHTYIHSHNTSHHSYITHASPIQHTLHHTMHHPFITLHLNASYHASPIHHITSHHIPVKHYVQQITLTHNALDASQRWCIITTMHHSDDASQQCIMALTHYGTTS